MVSNHKNQPDHEGESMIFEINSDVQLQEKVAIGQELNYSLSAENVYVNHYSEMQKAKPLFTTCFIP